MAIFQAKALLLDMDGTLVESTAGVESIWTKWCERHNIAVQEVLAICHGTRSSEVIRKIAPHLNIEEEVKKLNKIELEISKVAIPLPGAQRFLHSLPTSSWALVTSANRHIAAHRLECCELASPHITIASEDVIHGKPDPEPYQLAAAKLGVKPQDCLVLEDAPAGLQSGLAAGCQVIQVGGAYPLIDGVGAIIQDLTHIQCSKNNNNHDLTIHYQNQVNLATDAARDTI